ncbi:hypothetical protein ABZT03_06280 [Streptomyces sp. NPDC005574]|uniref:hypothetical protein n=1 Tax=Streptomyces sp. NPDC005574 TaxID=3156891 RepID=UPI0033A82468
MPLTSSSVVSRAVLAVATLPLLATSLSACSVAGGDGCRGTDPELSRLAAQPLLAAAPAHATAPANYRGAGVMTGCDDDSSGAPWLHADRVYAVPGRPAAVIAHYTKTAAAAGWQLERDPDAWAAPATVEGACWTSTEQGRHLLLSVNFHTGGFSPRPRPDPKTRTGLVYVVSVGTERDGDAATCWQ